MSNENQSKNVEEMVECCVKNCGKKILVEKAIVINGQHFCGICGTAYYRSALNI